MMHNYFRIGGVAADLPYGWIDKCFDFCNYFLTRVIEYQNPSGDIPYEKLSYGQLIAYIQKVALKVCQDDKIQQQLAKEKVQNRRDFGTFCE